jgi:hypothetical protein
MMFPQTPFAQHGPSHFAVHAPPPPPPASAGPHGGGPTALRAGSISGAPGVPDSPSRHSAGSIPVAGHAVHTHAPMGHMPSSSYFHPLFNGFSAFGGGPGGAPPGMVAAPGGHYLPYGPYVQPPLPPHGYGHGSPGGGPGALKPQRSSGAGEKGRTYQPSPLRPGQRKSSGSGGAAAGGGGGGTGGGGGGSILARMALGAASASASARATGSGYGSGGSTAASEMDGPPPAMRPLPGAAASPGASSGGGVSGSGGTPRRSSCPDVRNPPLPHGPEGEGEEEGAGGGAGAEHAGVTGSASDPVSGAPPSRAPSSAGGVAAAAAQLGGVSGGGGREGRVGLDPVTAAAAEAVLVAAAAAVRAGLGQGQAQRRDSRSWASTHRRRASPDPYLD